MNTRAQIDKYIALRYNNWLDYARHMASEHSFEGWEYDLLNDCLADLLNKPLSQLSKLYNQQLQYKGNPTRGLDKFILNMMKTNAYSPTAPFRKHTLGKKIIGTINRRPDVVQLVGWDGNTSPTPDEYNPEKCECMDRMHAQNIKRLHTNGFTALAVKLYQQRYVEAMPFKEFSKQEQQDIESLTAFLLSPKTLEDD